jgi:hypothetical protein
MADTQELRERMGLMTEVELQTMLGHKNIATVRSWRKRGTGPIFTRLGKTPFYREIDVARWIQSQVQSVDAATARDDGGAAAACEMDRPASQPADAIHDYKADAIVNVGSTPARFTGESYGAPDADD